MATAAVVGTIASVVSAASLGGTLVAQIAQKSVASANRSIVIDISNKSFDTLINPQVYTSSGYCYFPPQPTVQSQEAESTSFGSTGGATCGAVGVMTYDITENRKKKAFKRLAIMFSVPFDYNIFENWFALGLFDIDQPCDESLYNLMYNNEGEFKREKASGSEIIFHGKKYILIGTMSPAAKAQAKVELWDLF